MPVFGFDVMMMKMMMMMMMIMREKSTNNVDDLNFERPHPSSFTLPWP